MEWVCGFLFSVTHHEINVALLEKRHGPPFLLGKLNGIGGKIELNELRHVAMVREFQEEAGVIIPRWEKFCTLRVRSYGVVHMFKANATPEQAAQVAAQEDEPIMWLDVRKLPYYNIVPNLRWLVPLAQDPDNVYATVEDPK